MADNRTMAQLLQAPTEGYRDAIVIPEINANFELKHGLINLNEITRFQQRFDESFYEAWDPFYDLLRAYPHHEFFELQHNTFYNALNANDQDSLNSAAGGNFLDKMPRECLRIIESKSKVRNSRNKAVVAKVSSNSSTPGISPDVAALTTEVSELKNMMKTMLIDKQKAQAPAPVKAVEQSCVTCGGAHSYRNCPATDGNVNRDNIQEYVSQAAAANFNQGNTNPRPPNRVSNQMAPPGSTAQIPSLVNPIPITEPDVSKSLPKPNIPYPSRRNDQKSRDKASNQKEKIFQMFQDLHFDISFVDALLLMPRFAPTIKSLLMNKDKLLELAKIPLNENCSAMLLKKLPEKLGDPGKFIIPCRFPGMDVCHALADLGASINLMPLSIWKKLSLPELTPTRMILELVDRSITRPKGVAKDVFVKVGKFDFPTDFVVVDFKSDPRVPLILGRSFLRIGRALIDVYGEEITLRVDNEAVTFNLNKTTRYSSTYDDTSINRIDVIDVACEEFSQEVLGFSNNSSGGNPTSSSDPILSSTTPSFTPFEGGYFILEELETFLQTPDEFTDLADDFYDTEGDILYLEQLLNEDPSPSPTPKKNEDLKEVTKAKPSIEEPPKLELKDLPSHLENAYLEENDKLPVIIAKSLKDNEKEALLKVLKSHKRAIAWKITDIKDFSKSARPMTHLLEKETPFVFSKDCIDAFQTLKKKLTEAPILVVPDWNLPFERMCDASDFAIGAVLGQRKMKHFQPIHYASKTMIEAQIHYTNTEKEMLAIMYAFEKFRPYLVLSKSIVYTDLSALKYLMNKQDAKPRLLRWVLLLQEFDITIRDKKRK
ncbi:reverse transcriptase domain-containing protein [Tanacetum coccineum]